MSTQVPVSLLFALRTCLFEEEIPAGLLCKDRFIQKRGHDWSRREEGEMGGGLPKRMTLLALGRKNPNPPCSGQGRRGDMRMSRKHLTHLGL